jgi:hypothetical protein
MGGELVTAMGVREATAERIADLQRRLALVLEVGDALAVGAGWAITVKPGAPARRALNKQELQRHAETLAPLGLAPREVASLEYPGVSQLTTAATRAALARLGLTPEAFLIAGEPGPPQVVVVKPEREPDA